MRVVLDTNIFISALIVQSGPPGAIYSAWTEGVFTLLSCRAQFVELQATLHKPAVSASIRLYQAGRLVNE
jgi:hypothetical protein